ncbi:hypothetical protein J6590_091257 [Homalodisca vitripennis]|nr:hypothetical protein J6590_091257 [Homalodisca vitripennis]
MSSNITSSSQESREAAVVGVISRTMASLKYRSGTEAHFNRSENARTAHSTIPIQELHVVGRRGPFIPTQTLRGVISIQVPHEEPKYASSLAATIKQAGRHAGRQKAGWPSGRRTGMQASRHLGRQEGSQEGRQDGRQTVR